MGRVTFVTDNGIGTVIVLKISILIIVYVFK